MKISVIVPTYKPKEYLWECLDSLVAQTLPGSEWELLLVLNGCREPWRTQIEQYIGSKMQGMNVVFVQTDTPGVSNARNIALDRARGEYITFIDDDDYVSPQYLEELCSNASERTISLCYPLSFINGSSDYKEYHITSDYKRNISEKEISYEKARKYFSGPVYKLIHNNIIGNRLFDIKFANGEDSIFMFLISDRFEKVRFTSTHAVYYRRIRQDGASFSKKSICEVIHNQLRMIGTYTSIYFCHPFSYSATFYITRILGAIHGAIEQFRIK